MGSIIRKLTKKYLKYTLFGLLLMMVVASPVLAVTFSTSILITEGSGNSYGMLPVIITNNVTYAVTNGYYSANATDVQISKSGINLPRLLASDKILVALPVTANSSNPLELTTGNTAQDFAIITGYGGYGTVGDNATLEPTNNFNFKYSNIYIDTTRVGANITSKDTAFRTYISVSGNITTDIMGASSNTTPTGTNDPAVAWTDDANAIDNTVGTSASVTAGIPATSWSDYFEVTFTADSIVGGIYYANCAAVDQQIDVDYWDGAWHDIYQGVFTDSTWESKTFTPPTTTSVTKLRLRIYNGDGGDKSAGIQEFHYLKNVAAASVVSTGVTSGVKTSLQVIANGTNLWHLINGAVSGNVTIGGASVPNNGSSWVFFRESSGEVVPYCGNVTMTTGGTLRALYQPQTYVTSSIIADRHGGDNPMTITWGSNPGGVGVTVSAIAMDEEEVTGAGAVESPSVLGVTHLPSDIHKEDAELRMPAHEFYPLVRDVATLSNITIEMIWWFLSAFLALATLTLIRANVASSVLAGFCCVVVMGAFVGMAGGSLEWWQPGVVFIGVVTQMTISKMQGI